MEEWRSILNFPNYEVSSLGRVKSLKFGKERFIKHSLVNHYPHVMFSVKGTMTPHYIHRLVAEAFIPKVEGKHHIDHKNRIKTDNRVENLQWCTPSENQLNTPDRKNQTGYRNINKCRNGFDLHIRRDNRVVLRKYYRTLEEAIQVRDKFLGKSVELTSDEHRGHTQV